MHEVLRERRCGRDVSSAAAQAAADRRSSSHIVAGVSQWTEAAVKAIDRAFYEIVECEPWEFGVDPTDEDGAIAGLLAIHDLDVPAHSRMDLLIAQHATQIDDKVLRALARLFASSRHPDRVQGPNGEQFREKYFDKDVDEDEGAPSDILQYLEQQPAAGTRLRPDFDPSESLESERPPAPPTRPRVPPAHRLTAHTLSSTHIHTIRAYAEKLQAHEVMRACDDALGPPIDPLAWAIERRRQLAGTYNAWFMDDMTPVGRWGAHAFRQVGFAAGQLFDDPVRRRTSDPRDPADDTDDVTVVDLLAGAQAYLRDLRPEDVPWDDREDLHRIQTARSYDVASLRAMARLWCGALSCRLQRAEAELGRSALDCS